MLGAVFMEGRCFFMGTFHTRGRFPGRSFLFIGNLPCWRLISWKVDGFLWGPSMPETDFMEGRRFFVGTFHAGGRFYGRSVLFHGDLPCQRPILRKVLRFCRGPSMLEADFMEGPAFFMGTFHARGCFHGRSVLFQGDLPCWRLTSWKVGTLFRGTFDARDNALERARGERANLAGWR